MKLAFYSLTSCEGCLTTLITNLGPNLEALWNMFDIDYFKLVREPVGGERIPKADIAFVEGAVVTSRDVAQLREIRENSSFVVALGTCASSGNIAYTASRMVDLKGRKVRDLEVSQAEPLSSAITVDFELSGCPVSAEEFTESLLRLINNIEPIQPDYSVCYQCRIKGNACLLEKGKVCLGPLAMGGCGAACPSVGTPCYSCRGPAIEADLDAYLKTLGQRGLDKDRAMLMMRMFMGKKTGEVLKGERQ
jgi:coenzyme F420-reducing hydrogenase gamma subunit